MSYSQLKLENLKQDFNLYFKEEFGVFSNIQLIEPSQLLLDILKDNIPLA